MSEKQCLECKYAVILEDYSVGILPYVDDCKADLGDVFLDDVLEDEYYCTQFEQKPVDRDMTE